MINDPKISRWTELPDRNGRCGVTMIELLIVISIMSAVAILVIPQVRTVSRERNLREAARTVELVFAEASSRARADGFAGVVIARNTNFYHYVNNTASPLDPVGQKVYHAGYVLYQMRRALPWTGNDVAATAQVFDSDMTARTDDLYARVERPFDSRIVIEPGSQILFGQSPVTYRIVAVYYPVTGNPASCPFLPTGLGLPLATDPPQLDLICVREPFIDATVLVGSTPNFSILRRPEVITSSATSLPKGYFINLNYSGALDVPLGGADLDGSDYTWTDLVQNIPVIDRTLVDPAYALANTGDPVLYPANVDTNAQPVVITFGSKGGIDRVYPYGMFVDSWVEAMRSINPAQFPSGPVPPRRFRTQYIPSGSISLCITADDFENTFPQTGSYAAPADLLPLSYSRAGRDLLNDVDLQWVTIDNVSGSVDTSDALLLPATNGLVMTMPTWSETQALRMLESRGFTANRKSAKD
jgi:prepilin-type N-terminal cleavage/methylation domain-containing protein